MENNELYHYGIPGMRWGHRKTQLINASQRIKRVGSQIGKDVGSSAKNKYNNMNAKSQKKVKKAARVGLVAFTPIGITAQLAAHGVNKHVKKHPETIQKGKNKINKLKKTTVSQAKKYADMWNQR